MLGPARLCHVIDSSTPNLREVLIAFLDDSCKKLGALHTLNPNSSLAAQRDAVEYTYVTNVPISTLIQESILKSPTS